MKEILTVIGPAGQRHTILLVTSKSHDDFTINVTYKSGDLLIPQGTTVANWTSYYEAPFGEDAGFVDIGAGSRYIEVVELRGIGLGSFFMALIVNWAKSLPELPVAPIYLSIDDAKTSEDKNSRNQFWKKLGFELILDETDSFGESKPMLSNQLIQPEFKLANGWHIDELR
ncbi:hypothetical protein [Pseudomonas sp. Irchel 3A5]|uniref:hypothetical protein n=1 Tax=Pseudomonas sp. Irchel 3A5 TaxID=2008911 RepID=UPI000BA446E0|nr:hypothetical protein [Pseudomonas sp. Irchel 3A5]